MHLFVHFDAALATLVSTLNAFSIDAEHCFDYYGLIFEYSSNLGLTVLSNLIGLLTLDGAVLPCMRHGNDRFITVIVVIFVTNTASVALGRFCEFVSARCLFSGGENLKYLRSVKGEMINDSN